MGSSGGMHLTDGSGSFEPNIDPRGAAQFMLTDGPSRAQGLTSLPGAVKINETNKVYCRMRFAPAPHLAVVLRIERAQLAGQAF